MCNIYEKGALSRVAKPFTCINSSSESDFEVEARAKTVTFAHDDCKRFSSTLQY